MTGMDSGSNVPLSVSTWLASSAAEGSRARAWSKPANAPDSGSTPASSSHTQR